MTDQGQVAGGFRPVLPDGMKRLVDQAVASVVFVINFQPSEGGHVLSGSGSGFCWRFDRSQTLIITNRHVVAEPGSWDINPDARYSVSFGEKGGSRFAAELVGVHPLADIAVLSAPISPRPALLPFRKGEIWPCEEVIAVGNPSGYTTSFSKGIISALDRENFTAPRAEPVRMIQTDATINRGNSGGPLLGVDGAVVGVNTHGDGETLEPWPVLAGSPGSREIALFETDDGRSVFVQPRVDLQGVNFAVPSDIAEAAASAILEISSEGIAKGSLGIDYDREYWSRPDRGGSAEGRIVSQSVGVELDTDPTPDSPAGRAGLVSGDIIVSIGDDPVDHPADLNAWAIKKASWEAEVPVRFFREDEMNEVYVQGRELRVEQ